MQKIISRSQILILKEQTTRAVVLVLVTTIATQAASQNFEPIRNLSSDVARPYIPVRCGGLYHAIMERTGVERMGPDAWQASDEARNAMLLMGLLAKTEEQPNRSIEEFIPSLQKETLNVADIYMVGLVVLCLKFGDLTKRNELSEC